MTLLFLLLQASTCGYDLCEKISYLDSLMFLKQAEDELIKLQKELDKENDHIIAVTARLKFTRFFLHVLVMIEPKSNSITTEGEINDIVRFLNAALEIIPLMRRTFSIGLQSNLEVPCSVGFSPLVNQRLLPPTFPRFTKFKDRNSCFNYLEDLIHNLKLACKVINCTNYQSTLHFFLDFNKKAGSCLLSRTILQRLYFRDAPNSDKIFGHYLFENMLRDSIKEFISPEVFLPNHPLYHNQMAQGYIKSFLFFNQSPFSSFLEICGYNQARQREKFAKLLESFGSLQDEAERIDNFFYKNLCSTSSQTLKNLSCFGTWILYYALRLELLYVLSGR